MKSVQLNADRPSAEHSITDPASQQAAESPSSNHYYWYFTLLPLLAFILSAAKVTLDFMAVTPPGSFGFALYEGDTVSLLLMLPVSIALCLLFGMAFLGWASFIVKAYLLYNIWAGPLPWWMCLLFC